MSNFYDADGTHLSVYTSESHVVMNLRPTGSDAPGADHRMTTMYARGIGRLLIDHADTIDKTERDKAMAAITKRRNVVTQRYFAADFEHLGRPGRMMVDRIIALENKLEEK